MLLSLFAVIAKALFEDELVIFIQLIFHPPEKAYIPIVWWPEANVDH